MRLSTNIDIFLDREIGLYNELRGKKGNYVANFIQESYNFGAYTSYGNDTIKCMLHGSELGYFFVRFRNGIKVRIFKNKEEYLLRQLHDKAIENEYKNRLHK